MQLWSPLNCCCCYTDIADRWTDRPTERAVAYSVITTFVASPLLRICRCNATSFHCEKTAQLEPAKKKWWTDDAEKTFHVLDPWWRRLSSECLSNADASQRLREGLHNLKEIERRPWFVYIIRYFVFVIQYTDRPSSVALFPFNVDAGAIWRMN